MANSQQLDIEITHYDTEIKRMQDEREVLVAKRVELLKAELSDAVAKVIALGGTASAEKQQKKKASTRAPVNGPKKYLDPATGAVWSGQGGNPEWIKGKVKEQFLNPAWSASKAKSSRTTISSNSSNSEIVVSLVSPFAEPPTSTGCSTGHSSPANSVTQLMLTGSVDVETEAANA